MDKFIRIPAFIFAVFIVVSCNKYEEGPKFSLLTKKDRFARSWKLESSETNGQTTLTPDAETIYFIFKKNTTYQKTIKINGVDSVQTGNWNVSRDGEYLQLTLLDSIQLTEEKKIILLTNKLFKVRELTETNPTTSKFSAQ